MFAPQRQDPEVRKLMSAPAIRTFFNLMKIWNLGAKEGRSLLGWPPPSTFYKYKAGEVGTLSYDTLTRISLVLGIYKALHILFPEVELADRWIKLPNSNPLFGGKPALSLMVDEGIDGLYRSGDCLIAVAAVETNATMLPPLTEIRLHDTIG